MSYVYGKPYMGNRKKAKLLIYFLGIVLVGLLAFLIISIKQYPHKGSAQENRCKYYDRYKPDGSCDNSDPACPETIKDPVLKGDCPAAQAETKTEVKIMISGGK